MGGLCPESKLDYQFRNYTINYLLKNHKGIFLSDFVSIFFLNGLTE